MEIDPRIGVWSNFAALALALVGAGTVQLVGVSDVVASDIKTIALDGVALLAAANTVFHLYSAATPGPLAK